MNPGLLFVDNSFLSQVPMYVGMRVIFYTSFDKKRHSRFSTSNHFLKIISKWIKLTKQDFEGVVNEK